MEGSPRGTLCSVILYFCSIDGEYVVCIVFDHLDNGHSHLLVLSILGRAASWRFLRCCSSSLTHSRWNEFPNWILASDLSEVTDEVGGWTLRIRERPQRGADISLQRVPTGFAGVHLAYGKGYCLKV